MRLAIVSRIVHNWLRAHRVVLAVGTKLTAASLADAFDQLQLYP